MASEVFHMTVKDANGDELEITVFDEQDPAKPKKREMVLLKRPKGGKPAEKPTLIYFDPANITIPEKPKEKDKSFNITCMGTGAQAADGFTITKPASAKGKVKVRFKFGPESFDCEMDETDADKMLKAFPK
jgi:hypothetical protein